MEQKVITQPEGNFYDKYHSKNKVEQYLMNNFFACLSGILLENKVVPKRILEAGCGEGHIVNHMTELFRNVSIKGFDVSPKVISIAKKNYPQINFSQGNIYQINESNGAFDLVIASEVLEHLENPKRAVEELLRISSKYLLISVPREPLWRALNMLRGKYVTSFGNTPGHIQHWGKNSMVRFLKKHPGIMIKAIKCPIPWCMFLIEKN